MKIDSEIEIIMHLTKDEALAIARDFPQNAVLKEPTLKLLNVLLNFSDPVGREY